MSRQSFEQPHTRKNQRVAMFMDYENFFNSLKRLNQTFQNIYGFSPTIDFEHMVDYIGAHYGRLAPHDFFAVANFTHYDKQKGGLNKVATLIDVDSFEVREVRSREQASPGKKYVMENYADARLAFELGRHAALNPADIYIIVSGDKFFAAPARALVNDGLEVVFMVTDPAKTAFIIKQYYPTFTFTETQPDPRKQRQEESEKTTEPPKDSVELLCELITRLREALSCGIPVALVQAIYGVGTSGEAIKKAQGQGRIDLWSTPKGIQCISKQEERFYGKVHPIAVRDDVLDWAELLYHMRVIIESSNHLESTADWRKALQNEAGISSKKAKQLVNQMLDAGVFHHGELDKVCLDFDTVMQILSMKY